MVGLTKKRSASTTNPPQTSQTTDTPGTSRSGQPGGTSADPAPGTPGGNSAVVTPTVNPTPTQATQAGNANSGVGRNGVAAPGTQVTGTPRVAALPPINLADTNELPVVKPLPTLEKDYASATNRDTRLDIMMDIADNPSAESVRTLTRLFEVETDTDLKVDLLDSLLGIDGFKEEKLIMLTLGSRQGLPSEVRQSAIDGLIDLDDQRVIPVLNGLLNDPDAEIREGAQDALEMIQAAQSQPAVKLVNPTGK